MRESVKWILDDRTENHYIRDTMDFRSLPKIELHLHLDCCLSYDVVSRLDPSVTPERYAAEFVAPSKCTSLADFLMRPPRCVALMQTEHQLRAVVDDLLSQLSNDGVIHAEVRFAPLQHLEGGLHAEEVVSIVDAAVVDAQRKYDVTGRVILCTLRHYSHAQSIETVKLVQKFSGTTVVALDIAADEAGYSLDAHVEAFAHARRSGLYSTAHAGEALGPGSVWETLQRLRPQRIGHGVRSIEDPCLIDHLRSSRTHLEVCPSSNVQINVFDTFEDHSVDALYHAGVSVGINTDARTTTPTTLTKEYEHLHRTFGWGPEHFYRCNVNALKASFISNHTRSALMDRLNAGYAGAVPSTLLATVGEGTGW
jgi:adenosine deaminase